MSVLTSGYKEYGRVERHITVEDSFTKGMTYENRPLENGYSKLMVNFDLRNQGTSLVPRGGVHTIKDIPTNVSIAGYRVHHTDYCYVSNADGSDATLRRYVLLAEASGTEFLLNDVVVLIEQDNGNYAVCQTSLSDSYVGRSTNVLTQIHDITLTDSIADGSGLHVSVDANTYMPAYNSTSGVYSMLKLVARELGSTYTVELQEVAPYEPLPAQAINTGYNMLKQAPYTFECGNSSVPALTLDGVIPYEADLNTVKLNANVGESVVYKLIYRAPSNVAEGTKYRVAWSVKNLDDGTTTTKLQTVRQSKEYIPGEDITLNYTVAYKQCTIVAEVYDAAVVNAHTFVSDEDDYKNIPVLKAITVSSYYTFNNNNGSNANLTMKEYEVASCAGVCAWQQRVVAWGVNGARGAIWFSQPNQPDYFPYPNNVEIIQEEVIHCVPYLDNLLVFTGTRLYSISVVNDANITYFSTKCVQERLIMTKEDASTILIVKNMVYFKSGAYFYMIVPSAKGTGELQVAPVSNPIVALLDSFNNSVKQIVEDTYDVNNLLEFVTDEDYYELEYLSFTDYLDGSTVRNVYRIKMTVIRKGYNDYTIHFNLSLNYDTVLRVWTAYVYQVGVNPIIPFQNSITDSMIHLTRRDNALLLVQFEQTDPADVADILENRVFVNQQLLDTGYRNHLSAWKKRFREIQFVINNTTQSVLTFQTAFLMDDDTRKGFYKYQTSFIDDPNDPNYGLLYVERIPYDPIELGDSTAIIPEDGWTLDFSRLPDITVMKVRFKVSGKGYNGRLKIVSNNQIPYEILNINWVYRKMNAR